MTTVTLQPSSAVNLLNDMANGEDTVVLTISTDLIGIQNTTTMNVELGGEKAASLKLYRDGKWELNMEVQS